MSESDFLHQLEVFSQEEETGQQYFFAYLAIHKTAGSCKDILRAMNLAPLLWLTIDHALLASAFIALGRLFDQTSKHNVHRLVRLASDNINIFSQKALKARKIRDGLDARDADVFVADAHVPGPGDFRALRKKIAENRRIYEQNYKDIRDQLFAHKEIARRPEIDVLLAKTNIEELKSIFAFLHELHGALWNLYHNGLAPNADGVALGEGAPAAKISDQVHKFLNLIELSDEEVS